MKTLSIIVPVYNAEKYLDECILSIKSEMQPGDELILINDGAKDNSLEICEKYKSESIHIINNTNHGVSFSRNCGIEKASGEYITFVDADDHLLPGWRGIIENGMIADKDIVYFSKADEGHIKIIDVIDDILGIPKRNKVHIRASACWEKLYRSEFIKSNNILFDTEVINGEDALFNLQSIIASKDYAVINLSEFYYYRKDNVCSATHIFNEKFNTSNLKYIHTVEKLLAKSGLFSPETVQIYVNCKNINGLYVLARRISYIDDRELRREKYKLFLQEEYIKLYKACIPKGYCTKHAMIAFRLIKTGKYETAMRLIRFERRLFSLAKKVMRKQK